MDAYNSIYTGQQIDNAVGAVRDRSPSWDNKQNRLTGEPGQVVGFDEQGSPVPQEEGVPKGRTVNGHPLSEDVSLTAEDVGAAEAGHTHTAEAVGARPDTWMPAAEDVGAVPAARTVNGYSLDEDIALTAEDVGAAAAVHMHTPEEAGAVPVTRMVNGHSLAEDIALTAADVGAAAADHTHTSDGLSQEAADDRYLKLSGGELAGPLMVQPPTEDANPATKGYVDSAGPFCKAFAADAWSAAGTISIPQNEHGRTFAGGVVFLEAYMLVGGAYQKGWAASETYAVVESDRSLTLHYPGAENGGTGYAGKVIVLG